MFISQDTGFIKDQKYSQNGFIRFLAGGLLCFCLLIILWGAYVRISHSGDGCGTHWPTCEGQYWVGEGASTKTWIEWIHRATSGLFGIGVLLLSVLVFIQKPIKHKLLRKCALWILFFTVTEALLGAKLVLKGLTGSDQSLARVLTMNLHLLNSLLLVGGLFVFLRLSLGKQYHLRAIKKSGWFLLAFLVISLWGAVSALSSSLFPSTSLVQGFLLDFDPNSSYLLRLRILHPLIALLLGGGFWFYWFFFKQKRDIMVLSLALVIGSGLLTLLLLSPVYLKLTHLLMVYLLEISFLLTLEDRFVGRGSLKDQ